MWSRLTGGLPASRVAGTDLGDVVVLDVDATIVVAHSEKENASPTYKRTFGFHPLGVWCDNTEEFLAGMLRTGRAGSNTAADHITVLTEAIAQVPGTHRRHLLVRSDGAGASHQLLDWLHEQGQVRDRSVEYSVGFAITEQIRDAIKLVPKKVWTPALDADGGVRAGGDVAEITGLLAPTVWRSGQPGCASSSAVNVPIPAPNCRCSRNATAGATRPSSPTRPSGSWRSSKPVTVPTPGSRTGSGTPRTPAWAGSRRGSSPSTRSG